MINSGCAASVDVAGAIDNLYIWLGAALGVFIILAFYALSMFFYFAAKKKWARHKWSVEAVTIIIAVACSFVVRLFVYLLLNEYSNVGGGMASVWRALYTTIGGLTFEGMEEANDIIVLQCFYYGSSIYAGLMVLSVLTMKWNYEVFSRIKLRFTVKKKNRDIFVFTALNEETLELAKSIQQKYDDGKGKYKPIIVFSGPRLDAFDRNDDLCRQAVADGFLYWSYYKDKKKKKTDDKYVGKSISEILHLNNKNVREGQNDAQETERRFCVFAYESKKHIPEEESNMGFVFEDINNRINKDAMDGLRIEYYILTKRDINYQAYDYKNRELALEFAKSEASEEVIDKLINEEYSGDKNCQEIKANYKLERFQKLFLQNGDSDKYYYYDDKKNLQFCAKLLKRAFAKYVVVTAVNEALIISKDAISDMSLPFEESDYIENDAGGEKLNVYVLGFGSTGQAIAKAIHMRCAYINQKGYATDIHFEIFDSKTEEISGLFDRDNPMWICYKDDEKKSCGSGKEITQKEKDEEAQRLKMEIEDKKNKRIENYYSIAGVEAVREAIKKDIICPTAHFNSKSCFDLDILEQLDEATGVSDKTQVDKHPSIIVIALGSDYDNVRMANSLISDIVRESRKNGGASMSQTIIVNVWDRNNNDLICSSGGVWKDNHKSLYIKGAKLNVKIVGNNTDIYSYEKMADHSDFAKYNSGYNKMCKALEVKNEDKKKRQELNDIEEKFQSGEKLKEGALANIVNEMKGSYGSERQEKNPMEEYENIDMWKRESTDCVWAVKKMFGGLIANKAGKLWNNSDEMYRYLSKVEHQRWLRLHIANGWTYAEDKHTLLKEHNCILPFDKLQGDDALYNLINALLIFDDVSKEQDLSKNISQAAEQKEAATAVEDSEEGEMAL